MTTYAVDKTFIPLYAEPDNIHIVKPHKHYWLLELRAGAVVAACDCGAVLDAIEIENVLNSQ